jgi:protein DGCR14
MSPAAQHLLKKSSGSTPLRAQSGFGQALRSSYGASPLGISSPSSIRKRPGATPTPIALFRAGITPQQKK